MRLCKCHGLAMQTNGPKRWRCSVRRRKNDNTNPRAITSRRERQLRAYHERRKFDPYFQLQRQLWAMTQIRVTY